MARRTALPPPLGSSRPLMGTSTGQRPVGPTTMARSSKSPRVALTTLYRFCHQTHCPDGATPYAGLVQDTNGDFYGTTSEGGSNNDGTVFRLSVGLGPFVKPRPPYGKVGAAVKILGTNLTAAASVTFNGTAAVFTVVSPSLITTTLPAGASSGKVQVVTPSGTLSSNASFLVVPDRKSTRLNSSHL